MKKAVVFGGSGFLGSHVADALSQAGWSVTIYDLAPSTALKPGQRMVVGDIQDQAAVAKTVRGSQAVYNFAGLADLAECHERPLDTVRVNILGNSIILEACAKARVKRYVFASTVYVYGRSGSFYSASKQACENYIENYQRYRGLDYTILRYGSLYGSRATDGNIVHRFITQALSEGKMSYFGDGEETREYIHVDDAARYSVEILAPEFANQNVTITGHQAIRVRELMEMLREMLGGKIRLEFKASSRWAPVNTRYHRTPYAFTPKLGRKLIGRQYIDLGQGLLRCIEDIHRQVGEKTR
ncbi:MAG TPA: NAD-dependent epimerase [Elusimicrobia bacterium]|nr:NAD-dependent epimerase [Elusimicrobiota bacterium]HBT60126.1 NAD-dependent epimerase [Elusimicrobiota bacterium]